MLIVSKKGERRRIKGFHGRIGLHTDKEEEKA